MWLCIVKGFFDGLGFETFLASLKPGFENALHIRNFSIENYPIKNITTGKSAYLKFTIFFNYGYSFIYFQGIYSACFCTQGPCPLE